MRIQSTLVQCFILLQVANAQNSGRPSPIATNPRFPILVPDDNGPAIPAGPFSSPAQSVSAVPAPTIRRRTTLIAARPTETSTSAPPALPTKALPLLPPIAPMPTLPSSDVSVDQLDVAASSEEQEPAPFPVRWVIAGVVVLVLAVSGFVMHRRQQQKSRAFLLSKAIANRSREAQQEPPNNGHVERRVSDMSFVPGLSQPRSHADYRDEAPLGQQYETYEQHQIPNDPPNAIVPSQQQLESFEHNNPNDQSNNVNAMQQQQQQDQTYDHQQMHNDQGAYNHDSYQEQLYQEHGQFYSDEPVCYYAPDQAYYDQAQQPPSHTQPRDPIIDQTMD